MTRISLVLTFLVACTSGHSVGGVDVVIGAGCTRDSQCASRCYIDANNKFPGGFCSEACASDADCPSDTYCAATSGGVCLFACPAFDCASLGAGYRCKDVDHAGGGQVNVCIGD